MRAPGSARSGARLVSRNAAAQIAVVHATFSPADCPGVKKVSAATAAAGATAGTMSMAGRPLTRRAAAHTIAAAKTMVPFAAAREVAAPEFSAATKARPLTRALSTAMPAYQIGRAHV